MPVGGCFVINMDPGVQKPHWNAPCSMKASWIGSRVPLASSDSTVVTCAPSAKAAP
jgi:hypothetical protein